MWTASIVLQVYYTKQYLKLREIRKCGEKHPIMAAAFTNDNAGRWFFLCVCVCGRGALNNFFYSFNLFLIIYIYFCFCVFYCVCFTRNVYHLKKKLSKMKLFGGFQYYYKHIKTISNKSQQIINYRQNIGTNFLNFLFKIVSSKLSTV